ncbi:membrane protein [Actinomycetota bacterium]|nr:membrane protein [Actinomycetota bacterium]
MSVTLIFAIITITAALVFYTIGVFAERRAKTLKLKHIVFFALGLVFDITGTTLMGVISESKTETLTDFHTSLSIHQATGIAALTLMALHLIWAAVTLFKGSETAKINFHKFSIVVWAFWLVPYFLGMFMGMQG